MYNISGENNIDIANMDLLGFGHYSKQAGFKMIIYIKMIITLIKIA